jgi:hypothetical protein
MPVRIGEKVHYMRRRLFKEAPKRHVIGQVIANESNVLRVRSILFIGNQMTGQYVRLGDFEERFVSLLDSLTLVTILSPEFDIANGNVVVEKGRVVITDGRHRLQVDQPG